MTWVLIAALIWQVIDFLRELSDWKDQKSAIVTQLSAWVGGIIVVVILANAAHFGGTKVPGFEVTFTQLGWGDQLLYGLMASSIASTGSDVKSAFDNTDSAVKPKLLAKQLTRHRK